MTTDTDFDVLIIGGGINGCGIARDVAGRGLSTLLVEMDDLASGTSSGSTKLIHGGLRYLQTYDFRLVREALQEREVLLSLAPHIVWPLQFVLPHDPRGKPRWMLRLGLFLYDHLARRVRLPGSRSVRLDSAPEGEPLSPRPAHGFIYADCWADDARLVVLNALDAANRGAQIRPRTRCLAAQPLEGGWQVTLRNELTGQTSKVQARLIVNAAGPWVDKALTSVFGDNDPPAMRLVQGSHIVVPRQWPGEQAYIFPLDDGRVFFAIPYEDDFTLLGATERTLKDDPAEARVRDDEVDELLAAAARVLKNPPTRKDIVWRYVGVRPLVDDKGANSQSVSRGYQLEWAQAGDPPLLSILGGKLTSFRHVAEDASARIVERLGKGDGAWTDKVPLPGGDFPNAVDQSGLRQRYIQRYPWLDPQLLERWVRTYGTRLEDIVGSAGCMADLGQTFGAGLTEAEVNHLVRSEWALTAEDILWRRTKMGLRLTTAQAQALADYLAARLRQDAQEMAVK